MIAQKIKLVSQRASLYTQLVRKKNSGVVSPVVANLFVTTRCNACCHYCYTDKTILKTAELSTKQWKGIIDGLVDRGCRMINLMGGEPLLRDDFPELLDHILSRNILCDVNTNCFLVPEHIETLSKASQIFTSVDGDETAHDLNRGKGTFAKTIAGIESARVAGIPVRINCTVTKHNAHCIEFLVALSEKLNLFITFSPLIRVRDALIDQSAGLHMSDEEAREAFRQIKRAKKRTKRIMNSDASIDFFVNYPKPFGTIVRRDEKGPHIGYYTHRCPYGVLQHFITSNGDVFPCHNMWNEPTFKPKNVIEDGIDDPLLHAGHLWCKYCWLANLVEWNEFTKLSWLTKGVLMTLKQVMGK